MSLMRNNGKQGVDSHCPHSAAWPAANGMSVIREMNVEVNFAIFPKPSQRGLVDEDEDYDPGN